MKTILSIIALLLIHSYLNAQDTIRITTGSVIVAKVLEIELDKIKYKKWNNLDGPTYLIETSNVESITYQNGEKDVFAKKQVTKALPTNLSTEELFTLLTKKRNKVFIDCGDDDHAVIHATKALRSWGYWNITVDSNEADFILRFDMRRGLADYYGNANFVVPQTGDILKTTKNVNTITSWDLNTKRGLIEKLIKKEIRPMFK